MAIYQQVKGARPLLFERLADAGAGVGARNPAHVERLHDEPALRASIERQLSDLLNTRAPVPIERLAERDRTTIDYGIPDLSAFPLGQNEAMVRLARHVRDAIAAYEPRLRDPVVELGPDATSAGRVMVVVRGALGLGTVATPIVFRLPLGGGAPAADPPNADAG